MEFVSSGSYLFIFIIYLLLTDVVVCLLKGIFIGLIIFSETGISFIHITFDLELILSFLIFFRASLLYFSFTENVEAFF